MSPMSESPAAPGEAFVRLVDRHPVLSVDAMLRHFVPPAQFVTASLDNYQPDPAHPSQAEALEKARVFVSGAKPAHKNGWTFGGSKTPQVAD